MPTTRVNDLIAIASRLSGVPVRDIVGKSRLRNICRVRQAAMFAALQQGRHSMVQIGRILGRDHTTVMHVKRVVPEFMARDTEYRAFVWAILVEAANSDSFIDQARTRFEFCTVSPKVAYRAPTRRLPKPIFQITTTALKPILPNDAETYDSGVKFHTGIAKGSDKLLQAMRAA